MNKNPFKGPIEITEKEAEKYTIATNAINHVPQQYRNSDALQVVLDYDERPYALCPNCKYNTARSFLCRMCMLYALNEIKQNERLKHNDAPK